ncbi:hypothetical protein ACOMHN_033790 [Nucella lapillus]
MDKSSPAVKLPLGFLLSFWLKACRRRVIISKFFAIFLFLTTVYLCFAVFVPEAWKEADLVHVVRVVADTQNFEIEQLEENVQEKRGILEKFFRGRPEYRDGSPRHANDTNTQALLSQLELKPQKDFYPEFFETVEELKSRSKNNPYFKEAVEALLTFQPILTQREKSQLLLAFDVFSHICQEAGVTYFLLEASLMGVRRHHGMIPWDDDIDIVVNASQWKTLHVLLSAVPGFELYAHSSHQWKFYVSNATTFPDKPFKFPYLDIFFFNEDADFVWAVTKGLKHDLVHRKSDIFPLRYCPFEGRLVPVPDNLPMLVDASHDVNVCITGEYNHKTNENFYYWGKISVPCTALAKVYAFVSRTNNVDGSVTEKLQLGTKVLSTFVYKP